MQLQIKAILITDKEGKWIIHGSSNETPAQMFKQISNLWDFDPSKEMVIPVDIPLTIGEPEASATPIETADVNSAG